MRFRAIAGLTLAAAAAGAAPLDAQEWQVLRESYTFVGTRLAIEVDVQSAGALHILRGRPGRVEVAGRADRGFTAFGLDGTQRLTLTAAGDGPVSYMVSVPEDVWVSVRLPDAFPHSIGTLDRTQTFEWGPPTAPAPVVARMPPPPPSSADPSLYTTYVDPRAPRVVSLPDLTMIRSVTVRLEGERFLVATERPLTVEPGSTEHLVIRPGGPPMEIALVVPVHTRTFTLRLGDDTALTVTDGEVAALCTPLTSQRLSDGRRVFTFLPGAGPLDCRPELGARHGG